MAVREESWHSTLPVGHSPGDGAGRSSGAQLLLPAQQIRRDFDEAQKVANMFEHLEHAEDGLRATPQSRLRVLPPLLLAALLVALPRLMGRLQHGGGAPVPMLTAYQQIFFVHAAAAMLAYAASGPLLQQAAALVLRLARLQKWGGLERAVKINGMVLREEAAAVSIIFAWADNFAWWADPDDTRSLLLRPCSALLLLQLTSAVRKVVEFTFLRNKLRDRFEEDVILNAFERAALQRLASLPARQYGDGEAEARRLSMLRLRPILPDLHLPHMFERRTADMLRIAFGAKAKPPLTAASIVRRLRRRTIVRMRKERYCSKEGGGRSSGSLGASTPAAAASAGEPSEVASSWPSSSPEKEAADGPLSARRFQELLQSSTTQFLMQQEGQYVDIEAEAKALLDLIVGEVEPPCDAAPPPKPAQWARAPSGLPLYFDGAAAMGRSASTGTPPRPPPARLPSAPGPAPVAEGDEGEEGAYLRREHLEKVMPPEDADCAWRALLGPPTAGRQGCEREEKQSLSKAEFVAAVRGIFQRFHMIAATVKDYAAIWLVFSNVLAGLQAIIAGAIALAVFFPPHIWRTVVLSASTSMLGLSFVFGGLTREIFESVILIVVVHPYDVGDRIYLGDGCLFTVQKINILTTEVRDLSNQCVYLKNSAVYSEPRIVNLGRSLNAVVEVSFELPPQHTSPETMDRLNGFVKRYISRYSDAWVPSYLRSFCPVVRGVASCDIAKSVTHHFRLMHQRHWQSIREVRQDTSDLLYALLAEMRRLRLDFRLPTQPIQLEGFVPPFHGSEDWAASTLPRSSPTHLRSPRRVPSTARGVFHIEADEGAMHHDTLTAAV